MDPWTSGSTAPPGGGGRSCSRHTGTRLAPRPGLGAGFGALAVGGGGFGGAALLLQHQHGSEVTAVVLLRDKRTCCHEAHMLVRTIDVVDHSLT